MSERGPYFEDFNLGEILEHDGEVKLDRQLFAKLVEDNGFDDQAIHIDKSHAISEGYNDIILPGPIVYTLVFRLSRRDVSWIGINVGTDSIKHLKPVYPGDTLRAFSEVKELTDWHGSRSKTHGLVKVRTVGTNQAIEKVIDFSRSVLNPFRSS